MTDKFIRNAVGALLLLIISCLISWVASVFAAIAGLLVYRAFLEGGRMLIEDRDDHTKRDS